MQKPVLVFRPTQLQLDYLRAEAKRLDISVGELLRRIIDEARGATIERE